MSSNTKQHRVEPEPGCGNEAERLLLRRVAHQDRAAMADLFRLYHARIFKFVFRLTKSNGTADELVNDVMMLVWRKAGTFRGESSVSTWIFGIAYRQTMRRVTRNRLHLFSSASTDELSVDTAAAAETKDWIMQGLKCLPPAQQAVVVLVFYLGLSYEETARVARCPVNTVKTRMFHARRRLKQQLATSAYPNTVQSGGSR